VAAEEQVILPFQGRAAQRALEQARVELDATIIVRRQLDFRFSDN
jgi:hypothetical protein